MSQTILIPGANKLALETIADNAGLSIEIYLGQCIGLGLNLAQLSAEAPGQATVLFEQTDGAYSQYGIEFSAPEKPELQAEMIGFECDLEYVEPYKLLLPDMAVKSIQRVTELFNAQRVDFLETAIFFRDQWTLTRQHEGEILIDDSGTGSDDYLVVEDDEMMFTYTATS